MELAQTYSLILGILVLLIYILQRNRVTIARNGSTKLGEALTLFLAASMVPQGLYICIITLTKPELVDCLSFSPSPIMLFLGGFAAIWVSFSEISKLLNKPAEN